MRCEFIDRKSVSSKDNAHVIFLVSIILPATTWSFSSIQRESLSTDSARPARGVLIPRDTKQMFPATTRNAYSTSALSPCLYASHLESGSFLFHT